MLLRQSNERKKFVFNTLMSIKKHRSDLWLIDPAGAVVFLV